MIENYIGEVVISCPDMGGSCRKHAAWGLDCSDGVCAYCKKPLVNGRLFFGNYTNKHLGLIESVYGKIEVVRQ